MRRFGPIVGFAIGLAIGSVAYVHAQPGNPLNPFSSTAGDKQRAREYDKDGDHVGVNLKGLSTTPTPAAPDRCYAYCDGAADQLKLSVDGGAFTAIGGSGTGSNCLTCATPGVLSINGETTDIRRLKPKDATGTNQSNAQLIIQGGCGTGSGNGGDVAFAVCPLSTPGATPNTPQSVWGVISSTGHLLPLLPDTYNIGSDILRVFNIYVNRLHTTSIADTTSSWELGGGHIVPAINGAQNLGELLTAINEIYATEVHISGVSGTGKVVCVKSDGFLGVCSDAPGGGGTCTCG